MKSTSLERRTSLCVTTMKTDFRVLGFLILHSNFLDSYLDYESWEQLASADMQVCAAVGNAQQDVLTRISFKCSSRMYHGDSKSHAGTQINLCRSRDQPEAHFNPGVVKFLCADIKRTGSLPRGLTGHLWMRIIARRTWLLCGARLEIGAVGFCLIRLSLIFGCRFYLLRALRSGETARIAWCVRESKWRLVLGACWQ